LYLCGDPIAMLRRVRKVETEKAIEAEGKIISKRTI
jgi:hypothetical protein